jgi:FtsH-binding integral membrane protein
MRQLHDASAQNQPAAPSHAVLRVIACFAAGLVLALLSAWWVVACQSRQPLRAALAEGLWALAVVAGVGRSLHDRGAACYFAAGAAVGTWIVIRFSARPQK